MKKGLVVDSGYVFQEETSLTVSKTSLFFVGDGFTVYDSKGELVFRVDSYGPDIRDKDELVLMDPHGRCLLTVRRKVRFYINIFHWRVDSVSNELSNIVHNLLINIFRAHTRKRVGSFSDLDLWVRI